MDWGNCYIRTITRDASGAVTALTGELHLEGNVKDTKYKLTWLPQIPVRVPPLPPRAPPGRRGGLAAPAPVAARRDPRPFGGWFAVRRSAALVRRSSERLSGAPPQRDHSPLDPLCTPS